MPRHLRCGRILGFIDSPMVDEKAAMDKSMKSMEEPTKTKTHEGGQPLKATPRPKTPRRKPTLLSFFIFCNVMYCNVMDWNVVACNGIFHGVSWYVIVCNRMSWYVMVCDVCNV